MIANKITDASVKEQWSIIIIYFNIDEVEVLEIFFGYYNVPNP